MSAGGLSSTVEMTRLFMQDKLEEASAAKPVRMLDVGCGIGGAALYFATTYPGVQVDGRDINPIGIKRANEELTKAAEANPQAHLKERVTFAVLNVLEAKDDDLLETYDVIYSRDALLHIPHAEKPAMYASFYRWLKPNGGILCVGDYCLGPNSTPTPSPKFQAYLDQRGYYLHSVPGWKDVLKKAGFESVESIDQALWYCQTCQTEVDRVALPDSEGREAFLAQFSQQQLDNLIASYRDKMGMTLRGDRSYVMVCATKGQKSLPHDDLRKTVAEAYQTMATRGWIMSCDGNASARVDATSCILTPSGVMPADLTSNQCVWVDLHTRLPKKSSAHMETHKPTSEVGLHTRVYQARPDVGAIVHSHGRWSCALSCARVPLPPTHYAVCELLNPKDVDFSDPAGGSTKMDKPSAPAGVPCAPYHTYGTLALAKATVEALGPHFAVLMASHGALVTGSDMAEALYNAERLERECEIYYHAVQLKVALRNGSDMFLPPTLTPREINDLHTADESYGQEHPNVSADDVLQARASENGFSH
jgi:L-fuculose-phosphate aldolase